MYVVEKVKAMMFTSVSIYITKCKCTNSTSYISPLPDCEENDMKINSKGQKK